MNRKRFDYALISFLPMILLTVPGLYYLSKIKALGIPPVRFPWLVPLMPFIAGICIISIVWLYMLIFKEMKRDYTDKDIKHLQKAAMTGLGVPSGVLQKDPKSACRTLMEQQELRLNITSQTVKAKSHPITFPKYTFPRFAWLEYWIRRIIRRPAPRVPGTVKIEEAECVEAGDPKELEETLTQAIVDDLKKD